MTLKQDNKMSKLKNKKSQLGQFFTTNYKYILQNLYIPDNITHIVEPFAGNTDLLSFIEDKEKYSIECYDIDPKHDSVIKRDTLRDPPDYDGKFVLTNPPYLARNKSSSKELFNKYDLNDLYKCFLKTLMKSKVIGGIIIIPLNFWCSVRTADVSLRKEFLEKFRIIKVNYFEEQVFDDTSYTICAFQFEAYNENVRNNHIIIFDIYPSKKTMEVVLNKDNNYTIGGEIYNLPTQKDYTITRLIAGDTANTNIIAKCIDDNINSQIQLKIVEDKDIFYDDTPNKSARTYATLVITPEISMTQQEELVENFNKYLSDMRDKYHSLFLTNYRESKSIARKRITFDLVYKIIGYLLTNPDTID